MFGKRDKDMSKEETETQTAEVLPEQPSSPVIEYLEYSYFTIDGRWTDIAETIAKRTNEQVARDSIQISPQCFVRENSLWIPAYSHITDRVIWSLVEGPDKLPPKFLLGVLATINEFTPLNFSDWLTGDSTVNSISHYD